MSNDWKPDYPGNWTEDYDHDNGQYLNGCAQCGNTFLGHRNRRICKVCASTEPAKQITYAYEISMARIEQLADRIATVECGPMPEELHNGEDVDNAWRDTYDGAMKMAMELLRLGYLQLPSTPK